MLKSHLEVWLTPNRREVHSFDREENYKRGLGWYLRFVPGSENGDWTAVGEVTPHYLYKAEAIDWIAALGTIDRFVVLLRDPIERLKSHDRFRVMVDGFEGSLPNFIDRYPESVEWNRYPKCLERWFEASSP